MSRFTDPEDHWGPNPGGEERITSKTGGQKGSKLCRIDLIPPEALAEVGLVYGIGAKKYAENNWKLGYPASLSLSALYRHINQWHAGERRDAEGFHHLAAAIFHCLTLIHRDAFQPEFDDVHQLDA